MVMNLVAICLVATTLAAATVWSPPPATGKHNDVIVKEGHRMVVVEYDQDGHRNTKVSISPDHHLASSSTAAKDAVVDTTKEAADEVSHKGSVAKELICDAYGKCKQVVSSTLGRAKDYTSDIVEDVTETVSGKARDAKERAKETVEDVREEAKEVGESAARKAHDVKTRAKRKFDDAKDKALDLKESAEDKVDKAKTRTTEAVRSASEAAESAGEHAMKKAKAAKETTKNTAEETAHWFKDMWRKVVESQMMTDSVPGLMNLLGFVTAYGMCMWVTFISSYVLAGSLPRQQFAVVQSKIYPVYFRAMAYSIGTALLGHLLSQRKRLFDNKSSEMLQGFNLASALSIVLLNMIYLEPRATKVMFERMKLEKEEGRGRDLFGGGPLTGAVTIPTGTAAIGPTEVAADAVPSTTRDKTQEEGQMLKDLATKLNNRLKSFNAYSSLLNILTLMGLTWHLLYHNQKLSCTTSC